MKNKSVEKIKLPSIDELLGVVNEEAALDIEIRSIHSFEDHPFKVVDDEKMQELVESIRTNGVLVPVLVRPDGRNGYEMVSGHRRMHASKLLGLETIPAIIRDMSRDEAVVAMVDANIQREELLFSEKAFAYKMKLDAMKRQGTRSDLTSGQNDQKLSGRPKQPKYARNKNVVVIGGSGSGKTRFFVKPNLMQMHSSYVVTDPKGTVLLEVGRMLQKGGYEIKVLNTINFKKSMHYNPFVYIRSEKDILKLVNTIIANTKGDGDKSGEDFWVKAEKLYYQALIGYIWYEAPEEEKNIITLLEMINASEAREDDENFKNAVDLMFDELEQREPEHFAVRQYKKYKLAAGDICSK